VLTDLFVDMVVGENGDGERKNKEKQENYGIVDKASLARQVYYCARGKTWNESELLPASTSSNNNVGQKQSPY